MPEQNERDEVAPRFLSVPETARMLGTSEVTLYRAIAGGEFPAVRIRGRVVVPAQVVDDLTAAAMRSGALIDTANWITAESVTGGAR